MSASNKMTVLDIVWLLNSNSVNIKKKKKKKEKADSRGQCCTAIEINPRLSRGQMVLHKSNPFFLWLTSGSPSAAKAQHWRTLAKEQKKQPRIITTSFKSHTGDPHVAPVASLWFQYGRWCRVLNQLQCDTSGKEVLHMRWAFKY